MSYSKFDDKHKLMINPTTGLESLSTENSKKTPQKHGESLFSFPRSPKVSLGMISDLQDQIRVKEVQCLEANQVKYRLDSEIKELKSHIIEKDQQIERLTIENSNLKSHLQNSETNLSEYWKREVLRKSEGIKKIQEQMRLQERENKAKNDSELKRILHLFEEEKKSKSLKLDNYEKQIQTLINKIKELEQENSIFQREKSSTQDIDFEKQLQELELMQNSLLQENTNLKQELEIIRRGNSLHDLALLSADIHKISRQVHHLLTILKNLKQGKDISLYILLEMDEARVVSSSRQLVLDVAQLKKDLGEIKEIVSDYHAEIVGGNLCNTQ